MPEVDLSTPKAQALLSENVGFAQAWGGDFKAKAALFLSDISDKMISKLNPDDEFTPEQLEIMLKENFSAREFFEFTKKNVDYLFTNLPAAAIVETRDAMDVIIEQLKKWEEVFSAVVSVGSTLATNAAVTILKGVQAVGRGALVVVKIIFPIIVTAVNIILNWLWPFVQAIVMWIVLTVIHFVVNIVKIIIGIIFCDRKSKRDITALVLCEEHCYFEDYYQCWKK